MSSPFHNDYKEDKAQELIDQALLDYHYYKQRMNGASMYNVSVGRDMTKEYFLDNLYKCHFQAAGCMHRFRTAEEAQRHRNTTHGA